VERQPALPRQVPIDQPTVLLHAGVRLAGGYWCSARHWDAPAVRWAGSVWPAGREAWFTAGAFLIGCNLDWWEAEWGNRTYLESLLEADVPLRPLALTLLTLALAAKEPGESGLATDALIAAIDDSRLDGLALGEAMAALLPVGFLKLGRWAKTLGTAARVSPRHAAVIALALQRALQGIGEPAPKDLHALLEVLRELLTDAGTGLALAEAREALTRVKASGKTGKLVRELLRV